MTLTWKKHIRFSLILRICASLHPLTSAPWRRMNAVDVPLASCHVAELQRSTNHTNWFPNPLRFQEAPTSLDRIMTWQYEGYCSVITALNGQWLWQCCFDGYNLGLYYVKQLCLLWGTLSPVLRTSNKLSRDVTDGVASCKKAAAVPLSQGHKGSLERGRSQPTMAVP